MAILGLLPQEALRSESPYTYCHGYIVDSKRVNNLYLVGNKLYSSRAKNRSLGYLDAAIKHYYVTPQFMQLRFKSLRKKFKKRPAQEEKILSPEELAKKYNLTFGLLKDFRETCAASGIQPVLVLIEGNPREDEYIGGYARSLKIPVLSLSPYFKELSEKNIAYHYPRDLHWNACGHRTAAEALFEFLISHNLIPERLSD
jgi:hypothetical protein